MSELWARIKSDFWCHVLSDSSRWPMRGLWTSRSKWVACDGTYYKRYRDIPAQQHGGKHD